MKAVHSLPSRDPSENWIPRKPSMGRRKQFPSLHTGHLGWQVASSLCLWQSHERPLMELNVTSKVVPEKALGGTDRIHWRSSPGLSISSHAILFQTATEVMHFIPLGKGHTMNFGLTPSAGFLEIQALLISESARAHCGEQKPCLLLQIAASRRLS